MSAMLACEEVLKEELKEVYKSSAPPKNYELQYNTGFLTEKYCNDRLAPGSHNISPKL